MDTVREALMTNTRGLISVGALAELIEAPADKLRLLVEHEYLKVLMPSDHFEQTVVRCPGQRSIDWLRSMFQPLKLRPFVPLCEVGKVWGITERKVLRLCQIYRVPVQSDPVFGELMTFAALKRFARIRRKYSFPWRSDRAGLLRYFLSEIEGVAWKNPLRFSQSLEIEIHRIARLREPDRTIRSVYLMEAFRDAKTVTQCLRRFRERSEELEKSDTLIDGLLDRVLGPEMARWARDHSQNPSVDNPVTGGICGGRQRLEGTKPKIG